MYPSSNSSKEQEIIVSSANNLNLEKKFDVVKSNMKIKEIVGTVSNIVIRPALQKQHKIEKC